MANYNQEEIQHFRSRWQYKKTIIDKLIKVLIPKKSIPASHSSVNFDVIETTLSLANELLSQAGFPSQDEFEIDGMKFPRLDLRGIYLEKRECPGIILNGALLDGASLKFIRLRNAHLNQAHLKSADIRWAYLEGSNLGSANLEGADLYMTLLEGANLSESCLEKANLQKAVLDGADLSNISSAGAVFQKAQADGVDLSRANLAGTDFRLTHMKGAVLFGANLEGADLSRAHLEGAVLTEANLKGAFLWKAHFEGTDFYQAHLEKVDLSKAHLEGTNLESAILNGANLTDAHLEGAYLAKTHFKGAKFVAASLGELKADTFDSNCGLSEIERAKLMQYNQKTYFADNEFLPQWRDYFKGKLIIFKWDYTNFAGVEIDNANTTHAPDLHRYIKDQNYVYYYKKTQPLFFKLWKISSDCGHSFLLWAFWSLVICFVFGLAYSIMPAPDWMPGFIQNILPEVRIDSVQSWLSYYYFSMVTFSSLGFGDVTPLNKASLVWIMAEVTMGYIMLAGLIAIFINKLARKS